MKDERIMQAVHKVRNELAIITLVLILGSLLIKTLIFDLGFRECLTEYIIIVLFPLYQFIRLHTMKISMKGNGEKYAARKLVIALAIAIVPAIALMAYYTITQASYNWHGAAAGLLIFVALFLATSMVIRRYDAHRGARYEREFGGDED